MKPLAFVLLALACVAPASSAPTDTARLARFDAPAGSMTVATAVAADTCDAAADRVSALSVWVDGRYEHELLLFPGSGRTRYDTLLGPFGQGRHQVELRASRFWNPSSCVAVRRVEVVPVAPADPAYARFSRAPVLELRADTVGEQTDVPLYVYVEQPDGEPGSHLRYTVVFSNEDGGTQTRALYARWGRTTDIEQVYDVWLQGGRAAREEFQGPDHEIRAFQGRRRGVAPVLLVATTNNMVTDRGRGIASVRPVPDLVDLSHATRESTLDTRPWALRVMARELDAEGRVAAEAPFDDRWLRVAPDPRDHVYLEGALTLERAVVAAWVRDGEGRTWWSHYGRETLAIGRGGWVRTAVALPHGQAARLVSAGWACLPAPGEPAGGSCVIDAARVFTFGPDFAPGPNLAAPARLTLGVGEEAALAAKR
jgi:hypothetical protein